ncbi:MAG: SAM-dependent chlorinase/fluorinase [Desulfurobacteriaceae bacterium]
MENIVAIISDYGLKDYYVGSVHGVIRSVNPEAKIVDITHNTRPFDLVDAAVKFKWSYKYFPRGTVFLILVDPDPTAEPIIVSTENYFIVCPNNGVGSLVFQEEKPESVYRITADHYFLKSPGNFRGRDVLTPIAAELAKLQSAYHLGDKIELNQLKLFAIPQPRQVAPNIFEAIVLDVDNFGNLILNLETKTLPKAVEINGVRVEKASSEFKGLNRGELFISIHPEGNVQIVAYMANAAMLLKAQRGTKVKVEF